MIIVQKYGGTSVADLDRIRNVANRVKATRDAGNQVVVVVSARAGVTNRLISDAKSLQEHPDARELDMLASIGEQETIALTAIALHAIGVPAVSRTGGQVGIKTDREFTKARIVDISGGDINKQLEAGKVVIVAGFQGMTDDGQITTLGRGGSDLSAIALAKAIKADVCQIYTDVDGVYTADPRLVKDAVKLNEISYDEMLELASLGSKVMQARSVEFAKKHNVVFEVRNSMNNNPGTIVKEEVASMEDVVVRGVAVDKNQTKVVLLGLQDQPGTAAKIFNSMAKINPNLIEASMDRVSLGTNLVNRAGVTIQEVVASIAQVTDMMGRIASASERQDAGVLQVGEAVASVNASTEQNAALVDEMAAAAASLQAQADDLLRGVQVFKIA